MKEGIHPPYHKVLFIDSATGDEWVTRSTMTSGEKREVVIQGADQHVRTNRVCEERISIDIAHTCKATLND